MQSSLPNVHREELLRRLRLSYWRLFLTLEDHEEVAGLTNRQMIYLSLLDQEGPLSARTLSARLGMTPANITRLSVPMEQRRWIVRVRDPDDHRKLSISITGAGRGTLEVARARHQHQLDEILGSLTPGELSATVRGLRSFLSALEQWPSARRRDGRDVIQVDRTGELAT